MPPSASTSSLICAHCSRSLSSTSSLQSTRSNWLRTTTTRRTSSPLLSPRAIPISTRSAAPISEQRRNYSDVQQFRTRHGNIKVNLVSHRPSETYFEHGVQYQEDTYTVTSLALPQQALKRNIVNVKEGAGWTNDTLEGFQGENEQDKERLRQVACFGVFDGHGGSQTSKHLEAHLAKRLERSDPSTISSTIDSYRAIGGYLKRYRGGPLDRFRPNFPKSASSAESTAETIASTRLADSKMSLDEMCVLSFLETDIELYEKESTGKSGSVATIALLHSLDLPHALPFYASQSIALTIAHLGDTRAILASTSSGRARALTETHHPDSRIESERLRQSGTGLVTDSFGESRWGGTLANTRGLGDREFKSLGVFAEPDVSTLVLKGDEWSFLTLVTDGITDSMSDQEIVDLTRGIQDPTMAAKKIVAFAEDVGGEDNMTCLVIPLPGWGKMGGMDSSASRREYRLNQVQGNSSRQKRM